MKHHPENGVHPGIKRFQTIRIVAEKAVDQAYSTNPQATEEQRRKLAGDLSWTLLSIRFGVGDTRTTWQNFKTSVRTFPNSPKT